MKAALADGWTFKVLTPVYTVHFGLQNMNTLINPGNEKVLRRNQTAKNRKVFDRYLKEVFNHNNTLIFASLSFDMCSSCNFISIIIKLNGILLQRILLTFMHDSWNIRRSYDSRKRKAAATVAKKT
jgi:hypothetical protein